MIFWFIVGFIIWVVSMRIVWHFAWKRRQSLDAKIADKYVVKYPDGRQDVTVSSAVAAKIREG